MAARGRLHHGFGERSRVQSPRPARRGRVGGVVGQHHRAGIGRNGSVRLVCDAGRLRRPVNTCGGRQAAASPRHRAFVQQGKTETALDRNQAFAVSGFRGSPKPMNQEHARTRGRHEFQFSGFEV